jgi:hypothetical protein
VITDMVIVERLGDEMKEEEGEERKSEEDEKGKNKCRGEGERQTTVEGKTRQKHKKKRGFGEFQKGNDHIFFSTPAKNLTSLNSPFPTPSKISD